MVYVSYPQIFRAIDVEKFWVDPLYKVKCVIRDARALKSRVNYPKSRAIKGFRPNLHMRVALR